MAKDRDRSSSNDDATRDATRKEGERKRVIGRGMTSPDSTQVPLKAETGEPDYDAIKGRIPPEDRDRDEDSERY